MRTFVLGILTIVSHREAYVYQMWQLIAFAIHQQNLKKRTRSSAHEHETLIRCWINVGPSSNETFSATLQTQNLCRTFEQRWTNVKDGGLTLFKCYTNALGSK